MPSTPHGDFAGRLRQVLEERSLSQIDLARLIGVTQGAVSLWLQKTKPSRRRLEQIAIHLELDERWLLTGEGQKTLTLDARRVRDDAKTAKREAAERLVSNSGRRARTITVCDLPGSPERIFEFSGATEEQWALMVNQIEAAYEWITRVARRTHPLV